MRATIRAIPVLLTVALAAQAGVALAQTGSGEPSRGALLYANHCIQCHSQQMHWRERHVARDWETLKQQVTIWQSNANLQWSREDIEAVAKHLNDTIYHYPAPPVAMK